MKVTMAWAAALCTVVGLGTAGGAFQLVNIESWTGPEAGPGVNEAALVIDWNDGQEPLAFGYRWLGTTNKTGQDLLRDITSADPRLSIEGIDGGFVSHFSMNFNLDGDPERFRPGWDGVANFWNYYVNNDVFTDLDDFTQSSHIVPPNDRVIPTGSPYAGTDPGTWVTSSTGIMDRPLVDGSWDGFIYADGEVPIAEPTAIAAIPEPHSVVLLTWASLLFGFRRSRSTLTQTAKGHQ